jgi:hypothetical protein
VVGFEVTENVLNAFDGPSNGSWPPPEDVSEA